jgi:hypothetical protein
MVRHPGATRVLDDVIDPSRRNRADTLDRFRSGAKNMMCPIVRAIDSSNDERIVATTTASTARELDRHRGPVTSLRAAQSGRRPSVLPQSTVFGPTHLLVAAMSSGAVGILQS